MGHRVKYRKNAAEGSVPIAALTHRFDVTEVLRQTCGLTQVNQFTLPLMPKPPPNPRPAPRALPEPPLDPAPTPEFAFPRKLLPLPKLLELADPAPRELAEPMAMPEPKPAEDMGAVPTGTCMLSLTDMV